MSEIERLRAEIDDTRAEVVSVLSQLDDLAELWGDEGQFRRCRDRLRIIANTPTSPQEGAPAHATGEGKGDMAGQSEKDGERAA
jgi:hypothetical protein